MRIAIDETERRRAVQQAYNEEHGITPRSVKRAIMNLQDGTVVEADYVDATRAVERAQQLDVSDPAELRAAIEALRAQMHAAAEDLDFERAAELRDRARELEQLELALG